MRTRVMLLLVAFVWALPAGGAGAAVRSGENRAPATAFARQITEAPDLEAGALAAINQFRRENGLQELRPSKALFLAASSHSASMAKHGFFGHGGYGGTPFWQRIKPMYRPLPNASWGVGENMLWASPGLSARAAIEMWLKSPPHRKNLLTPAWREVGLGAVRALAAPGVFQGLDVTILTADFGVR